MNELEEIITGKHEIKHLKIDNDTLSFNTELDNYDWNLTPRDIEIIIYTLQEDKNNLQSKIDKANEMLDGLLKDAYYNGEYIQYDYSTNDLLELKDVLKEDK